MDFVLTSGDQAVFNPGFAPAIVVAPAGVLTGSGSATVSGLPVCVQGDEVSVVVTAAYTTPTFPQPGAGILTITGLAPDQVATMSTSGGRPVLLKGSTFQARMQVVAPASNPSSVDTVPVYSGAGTFITSNTVTRAG
ncbi:hypothetical protein [Roseospira navarrensis]|uniref:Uncharacterized protein n=1 Tax=Roseospira navarrensis TaxID=140058 RepID=A0A7X2D556_9PROT|nr:hypothetical protein [Roseospira navarrensis]MQX37342.1 hypothetical protein [Roseospira navarrensis]